MKDDNKIDLNRYFIKEDTRIAKKDMGRCSTSFVCREMENKTTTGERINKLCLFILWNTNYQ